jgi:hypothetical protein
MSKASRATLKVAQVPDYKQETNNPLAARAGRMVTQPGWIVTQPGRLVTPLGRMVAQPGRLFTHLGRLLTPLVSHVRGGSPARIVPANQCIA